MSRFVTLKQIADRLKMSEKSVRRCQRKLGLEKARDPIFRNRFFADLAEKELRGHGYDVEF